ncbi:MAG TPA: YebC/PmpR family DNA-binding transcriptional regulator [Candidatus Paceibacterota bacterium]
MAGHSKWAKLKHQKAITDVRKAKVFSKLLRVISVEAKKAKGDRTAPSLRAAVDKARAANVPSDNIDRAIDKATSSGGAELEPVLYEAYGPGGVALIIDGYTDNRNRTAAEIKHLLSKHGCALANPGAAIWAFTKTDEGYEPTTTVEISDEDGERLSALVDALDDHDDVSEVYTNAA